MRIMFYALLGMVCLGACKNSEGDVVRMAATVQVIHAVVDVPTVKVNLLAGGILAP